MAHKIIILLYFSFSISLLSAQKTVVGNASFYSDEFDGRTTASGVVFKQNKLTAAHRTLPFGSKIRVTNLENKKTVEVLINDRGPFVNTRIIDISKSAARKLDFIEEGTVRVKVEVLEVSKDGMDKDYNPKATNKQVYTNTVSKTSYIDYCKVGKKKISPKGYGIQVASYKDVANLIKRCNEIKSKTNKNVLVQIVETNRQKIYRIIIMPFSTHQKANDFNRKLKNKFAGSFVVAF